MHNYSLNKGFAHRLIKLSEIIHLFPEARIPKLNAVLIISVYLSLVLSQTISDCLQCTF